jgi:hypothetical protein
MVLRDDLAVDVDPKSCVPTPNPDVVQRLLDFLEMKNMRRRLDDAFSHWSSATPASASSSHADSSRMELATSFDVATSKNTKDVRSTLKARTRVGIGATWSGAKNQQRLVSVAMATEETAWVVPGGDVEHQLRPLHAIRLGLNPVGSQKDQGGRQGHAFITVKKRVILAEVKQVGGRDFGRILKHRAAKHAGPGRS